MLPSHPTHDPSWSFMLPNQDEVICFACMLEIMEDEDMLSVKKRRALIQLSSLIQLHHVVEKLECNSHIVSHILLVLLELMKSEDTEFSSSVLDVFMKLMKKLDSVDLIMFVTNIIKEECSTSKDHKMLLSLYLLLGRLLQNSSNLVHWMQQDCDQLLRRLCCGLSCPEEEVQSAVAFIMVYILSGQWEATLSSAFLHQLAHEIISVLNSGKSYGLIVNALVVLKKLIDSEDMTSLLMKLNVADITTLSLLKKLIISKNVEYQGAAISILAAIVDKNSGEHCVAVLESDILGFIFEAMQCRNVQILQSIFRCLKPLCLKEEFYSRCHSVYGIDSVLRSLMLIMDMKNFELMEDGFITLSSILLSQPKMAHLFLNSTSVKNCLNTICTGLSEQNQNVFCSAMMAFQNILRKEHLLRPVPFEILQSHLVALSSKIWQQCFVNSFKPSMKTKQSGTSISRTVDLFLAVCLAAFRLQEECTGDPTACQSNYDSPSKEENQYESLNEFRKNLYTVSSECAIPVSLAILEREFTTFHLIKLLKLIDNLSSKFQEEEMCVTCIFKLISTGFLCKVLEYRSQFDDKEMMMHVDKFISNVLKVLLWRDDPGGVDLLWERMNVAVSKMNYPFSSLPKVLTTIHIATEALQVYLYLLYHMFLMDDSPLCDKDLVVMVKQSCSVIKEGLDIPVIVKRSLLFLWAYASCLENVNVEISSKECAGMKFLINLVSNELPTHWYTHHPALVYWISKDMYVCTTVGTQILTEWLSNLGEVISEIGFLEWLELPDVQVVMDMFSRIQFTKMFLNFFCVPTKSQILQTAYNLCQVYIDTLSDTEEDMHIMEVIREELKKNLNETFLHAVDKDQNLQHQLQLLLSTYRTLPFDLDIKLFYHASKWIIKNENSTEKVLELCLQLLHEYTQHKPDSTSKGIVPLLLQNNDLMNTLSYLLSQGTKGARSCVGKILAQMLVYQEQDSVQLSTRISLNIHAVEDHLRGGSIWEIDAFLKLLTALLDCRFSSKLVSLKGTGHFPQDENSPFITKDFQVLFVYLQQMVTKDGKNVHTLAFTCLNSLLEYLKDKYSVLAEDLFGHPWNSLLIEVLCHTIQSEESITLFQEFLGKITSSKSGREMIKKGNLSLLISNFEKSLKVSIPVNKEGLDHLSVDIIFDDNK